MLLMAAEFEAGAQQLAAAWQASLPEQPPWRWVRSHAPFAAAMGGGYLARQHTMSAAEQPPRPVPQQPPSAGGGAASGDVERLMDEEEEPDVANARRCCGAGGGSEPDSASPAGPGGAAVVPAPAAATAAAPGIVLSCHIAYHPSYQVPVMYLEAVGRDGAPLGLPALLAALPRLREAVEGGQAYTVLTQEEHPFLRRPWLMLHPCQTAAIMQLLTDAEGGPGQAACAAQPIAAAAAVAAGEREAARPRPLRYLLAWLSVVGQPLGIRLPPELWSRCC